MKWRLCRKGNHTHLAGACLECRRATTETSTHLESASASHQGAVASLLEKVEECSMAAPSQRHKGTKTILHVRGWLKCRRQRRARTLRPQSHKPGGRRTSLLDQVERSMAAPSQRHKARPSASTSYRIAVLLTQVERSMVAATSQRQSDHHAGACLENLGVRR